MNLDILRRCVDELEQFQKRKETVGRGEDSETKRTINYLKRIIIANEPDEKIKLATEIRDFLEKHGGRDANSANEPGKWNSRRIRDRARAKPIPAQVLPSRFKLATRRLRRRWNVVA